jgi:hypothetical protein
MGGEGTPGSISNPEVKLSSADGTALETGWESRSLPKELALCSLRSGGRWFSGEMNIISSEKHLTHADERGIIIGTLNDKPLTNQSTPVRFGVG